MTEYTPAQITVKKLSNMHIKKGAFKFSPLLIYNLGPTKEEPARPNTVTKLLMPNTVDKNLPLNQELVIAV